MMPTGEAIWASLPVPGFVVDSDDEIASVNTAAEIFVNAPARLLAGVPFLDRLAIDAPIEDALMRARRHRAPVFINNADVTAGQSPPLLCNIQIGPVQGTEDHVLLILEPRRLADRMSRAQARASSTRSAIGMADMLTHEIKNPLAGITGAAQLLSMNLEPQDRELTDLIVQESRRIVALLEKVEQFGHAGPPQRETVNVHDLLDRARKSASVGFAASMRFVEDYDPSLPPTSGDGDQLQQVFLNLFKNAAEAAGTQGGTITLRTFFDLTLRLRRTDGTGSQLPLQIEITDDGPGLPADLEADIFDPFVSGRKNGTGLGLALVSKIVNEHGGWIGVESTPGRTVFRISLRVAETSAQGEI